MSIQLDTPEAELKTLELTLSPDPKFLNRIETLEPVIVKVTPVHCEPEIVRLDAGHWTVQEVAVFNDHRRNRGDDDPDDWIIMVRPFAKYGRDIEPVQSARRDLQRLNGAASAPAEGSNELPVIRINVVGIETVRVDTPVLVQLHCLTFPYIYGQEEPKFLLNPGTWEFSEYMDCQTGCWRLSMMRFPAEPTKAPRHLRSV